MKYLSAGPQYSASPLIAAEQALVIVLQAPQGPKPPPEPWILGRWLAWASVILGALSLVATILG